MARIDDRNLAGADGEWFVDNACFDCDAARHVAPGLIGTDASGRSIFLRQPETAADLEMAWRAVEVCPTRSVGHESLRRPQEPVFPQDLGGGVLRLGHNARSSFGAHSYLITSPAGNVMVDSPRWTRDVYRPLDDLGGLASVLLTHRDDVADAERYAERFGADVWIHAEDSVAAPYATHLLEGTDPTEVRPDIVAFPVPGHTKGSVLYVVDDHMVFSGDSLAWDPRGEHLTAFRGACWYSWPAQRQSLGRFASSGITFDRLFCGHGWSHDATAATFGASLDTLVEQMR